MATRDNKFIRNRESRQKRIRECLTALERYRPLTSDNKADLFYHISNAIYAWNRDLNEQLNEVDDDIWRDVMVAFLDDCLK